MMYDEDHEDCTDDTCAFERERKARYRDMLSKVRITIGNQGATS